ncbi:hypothetical protein ACQ7HM_07480 [Williamsia sp. MIQD14]|uniref:hypothetical protein n=1 Tax=Williamsia sp. MIQD14 TaxID=3425703 RepID=UPI003DA08651
MTDADTTDPGTNRQDPTLAGRMAQITSRYPDRPVLAFDADGKLMDWREDDASDWANGSHADERIYEIDGGADEQAVSAAIAAAD